jgi:adenylosuccinate synthase
MRSPNTASDLVITPAHQSANRVRELARGAGAHGTCGMGIGETMADALAHPELALRAADFENRPKVRERLRRVCQLKRAQLSDVIDRDHPRIRQIARTILEPSWIEAAVDNYSALAKRARVLDPPAIDAMLREAGTLLFEGAQGVLLDERFGFHPHTTWSTTTFANAGRLLDEAGHDGSRLRVGVLRTYFTRHGAGPLVTEDASLRDALPEPHNEDAGWQGRFRVGVFDAVAARYAIEACGGADCLAITHVDRLPLLPRKVCVAYDLRIPDRVSMASSGDAERLKWITQLSTLADPEQLTEVCRHAHPVYEEVEGPGADSMLARIEGEAGIPIGIRSFGPTATDKRALWPRL